MILKKYEIHKIVNIIKNEELKYFVEYFLEHDVPKQFFTASSSSTGRYHPPEDNGKGGSLRHTLKAIQVGIDLSYLYNLSNYNKDIIISALLLHDTFKNWKNGIWDKYTNYEHGKIGADKIRHRTKDMYYFVLGNLFSVKTYRQLLKIAHLVEIHMGRWAKPKAYLNRFRKRLEQIVIEADYIASRKGISFTVDKIVG